MNTKFLGDRTTKYMSLRGLTSYTTAVLSGPMYAYFFDARAVAYFTMTLPFMVSLFWRACEFVACFHPTKGSFRNLEASLDLLTEEREQTEMQRHGEATDKKKD